MLHGTSIALGFCVTLLMLTIANDLTTLSTWIVQDDAAEKSAMAWLELLEPSARGGLAASGSRPHTGARHSYELPYASTRLRTASILRQGHPYQ